MKHITEINLENTNATGPLRIELPIKGDTTKKQLHLPNDCVNHILSFFNERQDGGYNLLRINKYFYRKITMEPTRIV